MTPISASSASPASKPARSRKATRVPLAALFALALAACGGGGGGGSAGAPPPPPPPSPPGNQAPLATFTVAAGAQAGEPLVFDATGSTDPDGDPLVFSWTFGDGTFGGGAKIAHIYPGAGTLTATLTVSDGRGGMTTASRAIVVTPGPASAGTVNTQVVVSDATGPLAGATVTVLGGANATSGTDGIATVPTALGVPLQLRITKPGYADQLKQFRLPASASGGYMEARLLAREPSMTLADAAAGGTLTGTDGARITLPANALVDGNGNAVTGAVQISMTPVNVGTNVQAFPGLFQGITPTGERPVLLSYGTVEYLLARNGAPVQLKPGSKATIEIPIYTALDRNGTPVVAGATYPLWSLDERTSQWIQEGTGTVVTSATSPSGLALRAEVGHFSWWNCDVGENPYEPNMKCCIKDTPDGPCKENSGDICHHYGTGPAQPEASNALLRRFLGGTWVRKQAVDPATQRIPASAAYTNAPAIAGAILPMPADMNITMVSSARNGTYRGTRIVRGGPGVTEDVTVTVLPVAGGGSDDPITLPWNQTYSMQAGGEVDRFRLTAAAGSGFEVRVSQAASTLTGTLKVIRPDGSVVGQQGFGTSQALVTEVTVAAAGDYTIEVTGATGAPGAYRLEAASLGACASVQALTVPANHSEPIGQRQVRCYDLALAADDVIEITTGATSSQAPPRGSFALFTADAVQQLVARRFNDAGLTGDRTLLTGIGTAGTYRLRVANESDNTGTLQLQIAKRTATTLQVPGSTSVNVAPGSEPLVLVKPAAGGLFGVRIDAQITAGAELHPALTVVANHGGGAARTPLPLLPVVLLYANAGSGAVAVTAETPAQIAADTDVSGTVGDTPVMYAFEGFAGTTISKRIASPASFSTGAAMDFTTPDGSVLGGTASIEVLPQSGVYTAFVRRFGTGSAAYTLRVNNAPAPAALNLTPPLTQQNATMPLGLARRYTFDLAQGELVGLKLATPGALTVQASIAGIDNGALDTPDGVTGPKSASSPPRFVRTSGNYTLTLRSVAGSLESASGDVTLGLYKPVPAPTTFGTPVAVSLAAQSWMAYRYDVPADGAYLGRLTTPSGGDVAAVVWAASSPFGNYPGEFSVDAGLEAGGVLPETIGQLRAGPHTVTLYNPTLGATNANFVLVALQAPVALVPGAAATNATISAIGERDYYMFDGTAGQTYTVRVTAGFTGSLRVRKRLPNGDPYTRTDPPLGAFTLPGFPTALANGVETIVTFVIPADATFGSGVYVVEVDADNSTTGAYTVRLTTP